MKKAGGKSLQSFIELCEDVFVVSSTWPNVIIGCLCWLIFRPFFADGNSICASVWYNHLGLYADIQPVSMVTINSRCLCNRDLTGTSCTRQGACAQQEAAQNFTLKAESSLPTFSLFSIGNVCPCSNSYNHFCRLWFLLTQTPLYISGSVLVIQEMRNYNV